MANKRVSRRIPFRAMVKYGRSKPQFSGYIFNISENGIRIESSKILPRNSRVIVYIHVGEGGVELNEAKMGQTIVLNGIVAWVSPTLTGFPSKMGIKFPAPNNDFRSLYRQKLNQLNSDTKKVLAASNS